MKKPTLKQLSRRPSLWCYDLFGRITIKILYPDGSSIFFHPDFHDECFASCYKPNDYLYSDAVEFIGWL